MTIFTQWLEGTPSIWYLDYLKEKGLINTKDYDSKCQMELSVEQCHDEAYVSIKMKGMDNNTGDIEIPQESQLEAYVNMNLEDIITLRDYLTSLINNYQK
jgi:hypothetical protein